MMIIDPPFKERRTPATEFVMLMNGYSYGDFNNTVEGGGWVVDLREYRPFSIGFTKRLKLDMTKFLFRNKSSELVLISAVRYKK